MFNFLFFLRSRNGKIVFIVMGLLISVAMYSISDDDGTRAIDDPAALISGSFSLQVIKTVQVADGVEVRTVLTNRTDKEIISAIGILIAKDQHENQLMRDEHPIVEDSSGSLAPHELREESFFFYETDLKEIKHFSFRAAFVEFTES